MEATLSVYDFGDNGVRNIAPSSIPELDNLIDFDYKTIFWSKEGWDLDDGTIDMLKQNTSRIFHLTQ